MSRRPGVLPSRHTLTVIAWSLLTAATPVTALVTARAATAPATPAGLWQTLDDETGKATGAVRIVEADGVYTGNVDQVFDPADRDKACIKCEDDRKGQKVLGLQIIRGVRRDGDAWGGGTILDPRKGSVYKVKMSLADSGQHLIVRGFLGISLLGRSQTWTRME